MPSAFVDHLVKPLALSHPPSPTIPSTPPAYALNSPDSATKEQLQFLLAGLNEPLSASLVQDTVGSLTQLERRPGISTLGADPENIALKEAIVSKLLIGLYAEGIDGCLSQAADAETEAEWWADIERSRLSVVWYLLQMDPVFSITKLPIELTRQECHFKRKELEKIRDQRAEALGYLAGMRGELTQAIKAPESFQSFVNSIAYIVQGDIQKAFPPVDIHAGPSQEPLQEILHLSTAVFSKQRATHKHLLDSRQLLRPSRLTLIWPKLLLLPPLFIFALRSAYSSRATLRELASDAKATAEGFIRGWLLDPLKDVLKTVRAGGEGSIIIQKEAIAANLASLERMSLSLAKDHLNYTPEQLVSLSSQVKVGDLTPVLQVYEEDIKRPLKSAITGTLLRSVFIQVQKAKVDIDQTLAGIDKLLKSQELTFAFVGVAPAFGVLYLLGGSLVTLWGGGKEGQYGGKGKISGVWSAMRRTERLLISQPRAHRHNRGKEEDEQHASSISPLTAGLLLISVARLRTYAETHLPLRSRLREGFLEDVGDLANPDLGRTDKMRVVERMWRCWGEPLGWGQIASDNVSVR
ncbi:hypothetical protein DXG03_004934 [Asterophora parasitica]|uniref:NCA2-domain-containing protein n=1 Tax=Asterophora parasitica TaxID=117018 RepID=A0A9P7GD43_9AGAR|nr:hypothetical protein DXG03_004934 [Asterophora parasitica]